VFALARREFSFLADSRGALEELHGDAAEGSDLRATDWVLLSRDAAALQRHAAVATAPRRIPGLGVWSDDFNNLLGILK